MEVTSNMHTTAGGVAVVTTTLAQTDRRALSQAWYSALHLAEAAKSSPGTSAHPAVVAGRSVVSPEARRHADAGSRVSSDASRAVRRMVAARPAGIPMDRRMPVGGLSRRIAKLVARPAGAPQSPRAATVTVRGARVHVIVRTHGNATRIVALCPPPLEARVARALAQARFALAARGVRVEAGA